MFECDEGDILGVAAQALHELAADVDEPAAVLLLVVDGVGGRSMRFLGREGEFDPLTTGRELLAGLDEAADSIVSQGGAAPVEPPSQAAQIRAEQTTRRLLNRVRRRAARES